MADKPEDGDDALLKEARDRLRQCIDADIDNRRNALDDQRFLSGDQWPAQMRAARERDGRPCLTINKLPSILHQVTNDQRQNRVSIKAHPVDDHADEETADVIQGLIRHIEYGSNADVAYDTAVNSAAAIGWGYFRLVSEFCSEESFEQELKFKRIRNPFTVYMDPASIEPDGSDQRFCFLTEEMERSEFQRTYPNAVTGTDDGLARGLNDCEPSWITEGKVRVAEYFRIESTPQQLHRMPDGSSAWEGEVPEGVTPVKSRMSARRRVMWYLVTALEVLDRKPIDCNWIPVFPVYGDEIDIDGKVIRSGLIRHAKDPTRMYNFWMTTATEEVAMRPKTPYIGAAGQFDGHEAEWAQATTANFAYLEYNQVDVKGERAPPPQRQPMADIPAGALQMAMHAADNIKDTTGIFDASMGARSNETSGRAIMARQREGDVGSFHFSDGLVRTLRHAGRCLMWWIPYVYDTERVVRIMGEDGKLSHAVVNQPNPDAQPQPGQAPPEVDERGEAIKTVLNDLTVGGYDVTTGAGPSYTTQRQEAVEAAMQLVQSYPPLMQAAGDKIVAMMDWHGAEEIAERLKKTIPPQLLEGEDKDGPAPIPPQAQAQMQQMKAAIDQLSHALETAHAEHQQLEQEHAAGLQKQQMQGNTAVEVAHINADKARDVEEIKGMVAQLLIHMQVDPRFQQAADEPDGEGGTSAPAPPPAPADTTEAPPEGAF